MDCYLHIVFIRDGQRTVNGRWRYAPVFMQLESYCLLLRPQFSALVDEACQRNLDEMGSFAPVADIHAMQHAYLPVRLFSS